MDATFPYNGNLKWLPDQTILLVTHGSHAYGTSTPTSDVDVKGVAVPPMRYFLRFTSQFEQAEQHEPDLVVYDLRKFFKLAAECNPNLIEVLFVSPRCHRKVAPAGRELINNRQLFLSKKARYTFAGYAHAQLKRINLHYEWHRYGASKKQPSRVDFGLPERTLIPADQLAAASAAVKKKLDQWNLKDMTTLDSGQRILVERMFEKILGEIMVGLDDQLWVAAARNVGLDTNMIEVMDKERRYGAALKEWQHYQEWKQNRNPDRAALEERYGYDCKHGMHLVRLLRMCEEILRDGAVNVDRTGIDADELLAIRSGAWSYEKLIGWAAEQDEKMNELYKASKLPHSPDREKLDSLCVSIVERML
jgi:predicted nucleotidyltransferase